MYVPFQDAVSVPIAFDAGRYTLGDITLPRVDAIAAKDPAGTVWLAMTNVDPTRPVEVAVRLSGVAARSANGETLTAAAVDSVNTFTAPDTVAPRPVSATVQGDWLTVTLAPKSVTYSQSGDATGNCGRCSGASGRVVPNPVASRLADGRAGPVFASQRPPAEPSRITLADAVGPAMFPTA